MTRRRVLWWFLLPLLTFGIATFAVVGYAGRQLRNRWHLAAAAAYFVMFVGYVVGGQFVNPAKPGIVDAIVIPLFFVNWLIGSAHVFWLERRLKARPSPMEPTSSARPATPAARHRARRHMELTASVDPAVAAAQRRIARRNEARALLVSNPALAAELRIGRPDLGRQYDDGGLVDINHVPASVIAHEVGISLPLAEEIVAQRTRVGGFQSADDLVVYCEAISPHQVDLVRDRLLFTPT
ncbi:MAG: helix-hairpin-helix domain-containing protein [Pseudonocardiales bacterium]|nr:helix-hairpin-helix domain-containing protein [Pseudonocardiales bacterium]